MTCNLHSRNLILAIVILLSLAAPASAYGRSVEDLVGAFSIEKTVKIGSSSECFSDPVATDPLIPPQSAVASPLADDQPPGLAGLSFEPSVVLASLPQPINFTAHMIDDQGVWAAAAYFVSPSGTSKVEALFQSQNLTTGTIKDGYYFAKATFPGNETGNWALENLIVVDREGNRKTLAQNDLEQLGLPTRITVI